MPEPMPKRFWDVYNRIAERWYEDEYGKVEAADRYWHSGMIFMELIAAGRPQSGAR